MESFSLILHQQHQIPPPPTLAVLKPHARLLWSSLGVEEASLWLISLCSTLPARSSAAICRQWRKKTKKKNPNISLDLKTSPLFSQSLHDSAQCTGKVAGTFNASSFFFFFEVVNYIAPCQACKCLMNSQVSAGNARAEVSRFVSKIASSLTVKKSECRQLPLLSSRGQWRPT